MLVRATLAVDSSSSSFFFFRSPLVKVERKEEPSIRKRRHGLKVSKREEEKEKTNEERPRIEKHPKRTYP